MTAFLPQNDPHPWMRSLQLKLSREFYEWNYSYVNPLAMVEHVPINEEFSFEWAKLVGERVLNTLANHAELEGDALLAEHHRSKHSVLMKMLDRGIGAIGALRQLLQEALMFNGRIDANSDRPENLEDYAKLFRSIGLPPIQKDFQDDAVFAYMRIAGPNPVMLQQVNKLDDRFPVTEAMYSATIPGDTLEAAGQEGRLYLADYKMVEHVEDGTFPHGRKYLYAPLALFAVNPDSGQLTPVAIQCKQTPASDNPILTPQDGYNWLLAKTVVEVADANIHEIVTHLARTHLFIEPFVVATHRQLANHHPLHQLLTPHFHGTLNINQLAWKFLIANGGGVDKLAGGTIQDDRKLSVKGVQTYFFNEQFLPHALKSRGVDDADVLPLYPYRDDAMLYWEAIREWTGQYVDAYYGSDSDIADDAELSSWRSELVSDNGGRLHGIGLKGSMGNREYLADAMTMIIFTSSVQHAAVNFPQYDLMSYTPNLPLAGYAPAPTSKTGATEQDFLDMLPPLDMAELQMELGYMLGTVHYTQLGQYESDQFDDKVAAPLQAFQQKLSEIGEIINQRNTERRPYRFLEPQGVPQSINI